VVTILLKLDILSNTFTIVITYCIKQFQPNNVIFVPDYSVERIETRCICSVAFRLSSKKSGKLPSKCSGRKKRITEIGVKSQAKNQVKLKSLSVPFSVILDAGTFRLQ